MPPEGALWAELTPFLSMEPDSLGVQALAEYVVYQELPGNAKDEWLGWVVEREIAATRPEDRDSLRVGLVLNVAWLRLISEETRRSLTCTAPGPEEHAADDDRIEDPFLPTSIRTRTSTEASLPESRGESVSEVGRLARQFHLTAEPTPQEIDNLRARAEAGHAEAQAGLASVYAKGQGVLKNYAEAVTWYRRAAEQGDVRAQADLGFMYGNGLGVPQDAAKAVSWYRLAADQGLPQAQCNLGTMYSTGRGVPQDFAEAATCYRRAAEQGHARAQYLLGHIYRAGDGVPNDAAKAVTWYRRAAEQGHTEAQYFLGCMYESGRGVSQDDAEAVSWNRRAAEQGDVRAQNFLGWRHSEGRGVPKDDAAAVTWYRRAAEQGFVLAQRSLAGMYHIGRGVPQDHVTAHMWANLAASQSTGFLIKEMVTFRDLVARGLTPEQLAEAQRRAREWTPTPEP